MPTEAVRFVELEAQWCAQREMLQVAMAAEVIQPCWVQIFVQ